MMTQEKFNEKLQDTSNYINTNLTALANNIRDMNYIYWEEDKPLLTLQDMVNYTKDPAEYLYRMNSIKDVDWQAFSGDCINDTVITKNGIKYLQSQTISKELFIEDIAKIEIFQCGIEQKNQLYTFDWEMDGSQPSYQMLQGLVERKMLSQSITKHYEFFTKSSTFWSGEEEVDAPSVFYYTGSSNLENYMEILINPTQDYINYSEYSIIGTPNKISAEALPGHIIIKTPDIVCCETPYNSPQPARYVDFLILGTEKNGWRPLFIDTFKLRVG